MVLCRYGADRVFGAASMVVDAIDVSTGCYRLPDIYRFPHIAATFVPRASRRIGVRDIDEMGDLRFFGLGLGITSIAGAVAG